MFVLLYSDHCVLGFTAQQTGWEKKTWNSFATKISVACEIRENNCLKNNRFIVLAVLQNT